VIKYTLYVIGMLVFESAFTFGMLYWVIALGLDGYTMIWSIVFGIFVFGMVVLFYFSGKERIREEKRLIIEEHAK
jgi:hypothetical protein